jgi:hypothetical protein
MPDTGWFEISGEGESFLSGGGDYVYANVVLYKIGTVTSPRVRIFGTTTPRRVQFGGSFGLGGDDIDPDDALYVTYGPSWPLNFEGGFLLWPHTQDAEIGNNRAYWKLPPGITWWIKVGWP